MLDYIRDAGEIYRQSFATIRAEADLSRFPDDVARVVVRLIHTCGQVDLTEHVAFTPAVVSATHAALAAGAPILCDSSMVAAGITAARLPAANEVVSLVADPRAAELAHAARHHPLGGRGRVVGRPDGRCGAGDRQCADRTVPVTRTDRRRRARPRMRCSAVRSDSSDRHQSKQELIDNPRGMDYLVVLGRRGGSAMAAAAVNAIASERE